jgi:hypothetical protein
VPCLRGRVTQGGAGGDMSRWRSAPFHPVEQGRAGKGRKKQNSAEAAAPPTDVNDLIAETVGASEEPASRSIKR